MYERNVIDGREKRRHSVKAHSVTELSSIRKLTVTSHLKTKEGKLLMDIVKVI